MKNNSSHKISDDIVFGRQVKAVSLKGRLAEMLGRQQSRSKGSEARSPDFNSFLPAHPKNTITTVLLTQPS